MNHQDQGQISPSPNPETFRASTQGAPFSNTTPEPANQEAPSRNWGCPPPPTPGLSRVAETRFGPRRRAPSWPSVFPSLVRRGGPTRRPVDPLFIGCGGWFHPMGAVIGAEWQDGSHLAPRTQSPSLRGYCGGRFLPRIWLAGPVSTLFHPIVTCEWSDMGNLPRGGEFVCFLLFGWQFGNYLSFSGCGYRSCSLLLPATRLSAATREMDPREARLALCERGGCRQPVSGGPQSTPIIRIIVPVNGSYRETISNMPVFEISLRDLQCIN